MTNFDKVVKALECCLQGTYELCKECPYHEFYPNKCKAEREHDALELLKEQCGWGIGGRKTFNYCPNCGKKVKWE